MNLQISQLSALCWQRFDDEWVVFNEGCGGTLVADPLTAAILMTLELNKLDQTDLAARVAEDFQITNHEQLQTLLQERIESLMGMGWIESDS